jgi:hypothetical protein
LLSSVGQVPFFTNFGTATDLFFPLFWQKFTQPGRRDCRNLMVY